jgi:hypothetical protein
VHASKCGSSTRRRALSLLKYEAISAPVNEANPQLYQSQKQRISEVLWKKTDELAAEWKIEENRRGE